jgi:hypothetical protein
MAAAASPRFRSPADPPLAPEPKPAVVAPDRDYLSEVREEVNEYLDSHDSVISAQAAEELIARWEKGDPGLLDGWLRVRSYQVLRDYVYHVTLSRGARRSREEGKARFAEFADGFEEKLREGGPEKGREFYRMHSVNEGPLLVRKPLSSLNAKQVAQVRDRYQQAAKDSLFMGKVMEAVRMRVAVHGEDATVADVYTPEQLEKMFDRGGK